MTLPPSPTGPDLGLASHLQKFMKRQGVNTNAFTPSPAQPLSRMPGPPVNYDPTPRPFAQSAGFNAKPRETPAPSAAPPTQQQQLPGLPAPTPPPASARPAPTNANLIHVPGPSGIPDPSTFPGRTPPKPAVAAPPPPAIGNEAAILDAVSRAAYKTNPGGARGYLLDAAHRLLR